MFFELSNFRNTRYLQQTFNILPLLIQYLLYLNLLFLDFIVLLLPLNLQLFLFLLLLHKLLLLLLFFPFVFMFENLLKGPFILKLTQLIFKQFLKFEGQLEAQLRVVGDLFVNIILLLLISDLLFLVLIKLLFIL